MKIGWEDDTIKDMNINSTNLISKVRGRPKWGKFVKNAMSSEIEMSAEEVKRKARKYIF